MMLKRFLIENTPIWVQVIFGTLLGKAIGELFMSWFRNKDNKSE